MTSATERQRIAARSIAEFEASRTLARARDVSVLTNRDDVSPEIADPAVKAMERGRCGLAKGNG
jgi:hypothetical protein